MAQIINPTPVTTGTFGGMWVTSLQLFLDGKDFIQANFLPYDGTHMLATGGTRLNQKIAPADFAALATEAKRQANKTADIKFLQLHGNDPAKPVVARAFFTDGTMHSIPDCFGLCATDPTFAQVFLGTMAQVATLAGLTVTQ